MASTSESRPASPSDSDSKRPARRSRRTCRVPPQKVRPANHTAHPLRTPNSTGESLCHVEPDARKTRPAFWPRSRRARNPEYAGSTRPHCVRPMQQYRIRRSLTDRRTGPACTDSRPAVDGVHAALQGMSPRRIAHLHLPAFARPARA